MPSNIYTLAQALKQEAKLLEDQISTITDAKALNSALNKSSRLQGVLHKYLARPELLKDNPAFEIATKGVLDEASVILNRITEQLAAKAREIFPSRF